jgi:hypothetical protein
MEEIKPSVIPLAKALEDFLHHNLDIITDSEWFEELVAEKVKRILEEKETSEVMKQLGLEE